MSSQLMYTEHIKNAMISTIRCH